jgi:hypothetical protein
LEVKPPQDQGGQRPIGVVAHIPPFDVVMKQGMLGELNGASEGDRRSHRRDFLIAIASQ